eukprot:TRINITY_DN8450_c0_g1_i1.p1 TRINITY_DN8450_c0_g1~~TRINITY_DN8450_c0_g1_i1.p1  ORF type:complete len:121 (-),score=7.47 TRINITY_DN8450_c0_g1_i1:387-749(-)
MILNKLRNAFMPILNRSVSLVNNRTLLLASGTTLGKQLAPELKIYYQLDNFYSLGKDATQSHEHHFQLQDFSQILEAFKIHKPSLTILCNSLHGLHCENIKMYLRQVMELLEIAKEHRTR